MTGGKLYESSAPTIPLKPQPATIHVNSSGVRTRVVELSSADD